MVLDRKVCLRAILIIAYQSHNCFTSVPGGQKRDIRTRSDVSPGTAQTLHPKKHHPMFKDGTTVDGSVLRLLHAKKQAQPPPWFDKAKNITLLQLGTAEVPSLPKKFDVIPPKLKYKQADKIERQKRLKEEFSDVSLYIDPKKPIPEEKRKSLSQALAGVSLSCSSEQTNWKQNEQSERRVQHHGKPQGQTTLRQQGTSPSSSPGKTLQQPRIHSQQGRSLQHQGSPTQIGGQHHFTPHELQPQQGPQQQRPSHSNSIKQAIAPRSKSPQQELSKKQESTQQSSPSPTASIQSSAVSPSLQHSISKHHGLAMQQRPSHSNSIKQAIVPRSKSPQQELSKKQESTQQSSPSPTASIQSSAVSLSLQHSISKHQGLAMQLRPSDPASIKSTLSPSQQNNLPMYRAPLQQSSPEQRMAQKQSPSKSPSIKLPNSTGNLVQQHAASSQSGGSSEKQESLQKHRYPHKFTIKLPVKTSKNTTQKTDSSDSQRTSEGQRSRQPNNPSISFKIKLPPATGNRSPQSSGPSHLSHSKQITSSGKMSPQPNVPSRHSGSLQILGSPQPSKSGNSTFTKHPTTSGNTQHPGGPKLVSQTRSQSSFSSPNPMKTGRELSPSLPQKHIKTETGKVMRSRSSLKLNTGNQQTSNQESEHRRDDKGNVPSPDSKEEGELEEKFDGNHLSLLYKMGHQTKKDDKGYKVFDVRNYVKQSQEEIDEWKKGREIETYATELFRTWVHYKKKRKIMTINRLKRLRENNVKSYENYHSEMKTVCEEKIKTYLKNDLFRMVYIRSNIDQLDGEKIAREGCNVYLDRGGLVAEFYLSKLPPRTFFIRVNIMNKDITGSNYDEDSLLPVDTVDVTKSGNTIVGKYPLQTTFIALYEISDDAKLRVLRHK